MGLGGKGGSGGNGGGEAGQAGKSGFSLLIVLFVVLIIVGVSYIGLGLRKGVLHYTCRTPCFNPYSTIAYDNNSSLLLQVFAVIDSSHMRRLGHRLSVRAEAFSLNRYSLGTLFGTFPSPYDFLLLYPTFRLLSIFLFGVHHLKRQVGKREG